MAWPVPEEVNVQLVMSAKAVPTSTGSQLSNVQVLMELPLAVTVPAFLNAEFWMVRDDRPDTVPQSRKVQPSIVLVPIPLVAEAASINPLSCVSSEINKHPVKDTVVNEP